MHPHHSSTLSPNRAHNARRSIRCFHSFSHKICYAFPWRYGDECRPEEAREEVYFTYSFTEEV